MDHRHGDHDGPPSAYGLPSVLPDAAHEGHEHREGAHDQARPMPTGHGEHGEHDKHAGHSVAMFRDRFWLSLL